MINIELCRISPEDNTDVRKITNPKLNDKRCKLHVLTYENHPLFKVPSVQDQGGGFD